MPSSKLRKTAPVERFVALLRGINVGRAKRVAMSDLRALLHSLGCRNVRTLLNSGNAVFDCPAEPQARLAERIQTAVAEKLGIEALVVVKSAKDMAAIVGGNKLSTVATDPARLLVAFTSDTKALTRLEPLAKTDWKPDAVHMGKHAAYIWCASGILESKAAVALLRDLEGTGTTRNWSTVQKINALLQHDAA